MVPQLSVGARCNVGCRGAEIVPIHRTVGTVTCSIDRTGTYLGLLCLTSNKVCA